MDNVKISAIIAKSITDETLEPTVSLIRESLMSLEVVDDTTFKIAGEYAKAIKDLKKKVMEYFKPMKEKAHKAWKEICDKEKEQLDKLEPVEKHLAGQIIKYQAEQERKKREKEEELKRVLMKEEEEKKLAVALRLEQEGKKKEAERVLATEVVVPDVKIESVPKISGLSSREEWNFEIVDETLIPREFLMPDEKKIRAYVRAMRANANIPGIRVFKSEILVRR